MLLLISPAKRMAADPDAFAPESLPQFLPEAERLLAALQAMSPAALRTLWRCSETLALQNLERLAVTDLRRRLTPALLAYDGIQYRFMAPTVFETAQLDYVRSRLRILSGLYGVLRPFDGVAPYRLEMQARLAVDGCRDLYEFWGGRLAEALAREDDCMVNDELRKALQKVKEADAVVIGSPVYFMQVTGPVKNLYDRLFPLIGENGEPRFGKKKIVTVYTQDFDDPHAFDTYFDYLAQGMFPGFGFVDEDRIVCVNANNPETAENNRELKQNAYDVGRMLANLSK